MKVVIACDLVSTFLRFRSFIAKRLADSGHDVTIIASDYDVDSHDFFHHERIALEIVEMDRTSVNPLSDLSYYRRLREVIERIRPDRVLAYQAKAAVWSAVSARSIPECHVSILFPGLGYLFAPNPTMRQRVVPGDLATAVSFCIPIDRHRYFSEPRRCGDAVRASRLADDG